ncbi:DUF2516 family protein [Paenibacillus sp. TRM 82003]|uniref:DUF2516 family protein n=1 Tax=Kineococcus sp. TRM81007 TaxID=2925831 RepID=UPI001F5A2A17|nr:DUF2516 family protein [Kineococcus sp. TRM81007]MCI2238614.1 DUF2516 family protein [Kineococcus sp. TRM81007]MCI3927276.1 DUF2516 family protein [Paenibacillus sp. TRM 82003]
MTSLVGTVQFGVLLVIAFAAFALAAWALVDALRRPAGSFVAAGKRTKTFWVAVLAVAAAIGFVSLPPISAAGLPGLLGIVSVVAAAVYMADVRPAVRQFGGRRGPGRDERRQGGPYGPW